MYKNQSDAATHAQYQHQAKYDTRLSVCRAGSFQGLERGRQVPVLLTVFFFLMYSVYCERHFFFAPFGIYLHQWVFQKLQLHLTFGLAYGLTKKKVQINSKLNSNSYYYLEIVYSNHKPRVTDVLSHQLLSYRIKPVRSFQWSQCILSWWSSIIFWLSKLCPFALVLRHMSKDKHFTSVKLAKRSRNVVFK